MRLIDADALLNELGDIWNIPKDRDGDIDETCEKAFDVIENAPAVQAKPVVHGSWETEFTALLVVYRCSECNCATALGQTNFCPNCGADMRGGKND